MKSRVFNFLINITSSSVESGFQDKLKTCAAFVDLRAAYDTVWRKGLIVKLLRLIPSACHVDLFFSESQTDNERKKHCFQRNLQLG